MPHDAKGQQLQPGDEVLFRAKVVQVFASESACNAGFQILDFVDCREYAPTFTCNTKLCEKAPE